MLKFGIIAEGLCDQTVIENILLGYFDTEEPAVTYIQPPLPPSGELPKPSGWTLVFRCIADREPQKALQFNDYVIIHIDADVQEEKGFDVPKREDGRELAVGDRVARIVERLKKGIAEEFLRDHGAKIIFAVAVDAIECWLLPLLYDNDKAAKTVGCLGAANAMLRKQEKKALSAGDATFQKAYDELSRDYRKRKTLLSAAPRNPSLCIFVERLNELPPPPGAAPG